jgi:hypothetical protein
VETFLSRRQCSSASPCSVVPYRCYLPGILIYTSPWGCMRLQQGTSTGLLNLGHSCRCDRMCIRAFPIFFEQTIATRLPRPTRQDEVLFLSYISNTTYPAVAYIHVSTQARFVGSMACHCQAYHGQIANIVCLNM